MKTDVILGAVPVVISSIALAVAVVSMRRQWRSARNANAVTAVLKLFEEFRADDLRAARRAIYQMVDCSADSAAPALRDLPDAVRVPAERVALYFDHVGLLVGHGLVPVKPMIAFFGYGCEVLWKKLESYVAAERRMRNVDYYLGYFEGLALLSQAVDSGDIVGKVTSNMRTGRLSLE